MADLTLGVGVVYETTKVNLSNINWLLDSIRAGAPEGNKDLFSAPTYYEVTVVFGASIVSTDGAELASRKYRDRLEDMSFFEVFIHGMANQTGTLGGMMGGEGLRHLQVEPFAAISFGAGAGVGAHGGFDFEAFVSVGHFNDLWGFSLAGEAQVIPHAIQGGGLAVPIGSYPGAPGTKVYLMRSAEKILQPNGALEFEYTIIVSGAQATKLARKIINGDVQIDEIADYLSQQANSHCFLEDSTVQMWPLDPSIKPRADGSYDEELVLSKVWYKRQDQMKAGDLVVSPDKWGRLQPGRVTRTMTNTATHILDFWGTGVTPGHAYNCADGPLKGGFAPIMDILRMDGALMRSDGTMFRSTTNCDVGSIGDRMIHAEATIQNPDGSWTPKKRGQIRFGTRISTPDGKKSISVMEIAERQGWSLSDDGYMIGKIEGADGTVQEGKFPFPYTQGAELPKPEDYILTRSQVTLEEIYLANEWEQISTRMPAPSSLAGFYPNSTMKRTKPKPNIPTAFASRPDAPTAKNQAQRPAHASPSAPGMNRKERKAMEAKQGEAGKTRRQLLGQLGDS